MQPFQWFVSLKKQMPVCLFGGGGWSLTATHTPPTAREKRTARRAIFRPPRDSLGVWRIMSSRELLEMLGSGAAFGKKAHQSSEQRKDAKKPPSTSTVNFFAAAGGAPSSAGKKRRRAPNDGHKVRPSAVASQALVNKSSSKPAPRPSIKGKNGGGSALALFSQSPAASTSAGKGNNSEGVVEGELATGEMKTRCVRLEEIACFRRRMGIKVRGEQVAEPMESFGDMPAAGPGDDARQTRRVVLRNVEESTWKEPTPVQMQSVPILVAGRDLLAAAPTGSGKTAAFVMPMILRLGLRRACAEASGSGVRGLLLAPTRELAAQIHRDVVRLSRGRKLRVCLLTKAGSAKAAAATGMDSKKALSGYDIVVSTPLRLVTLVREGAVSLASVEMVVLDEADKLFDAGGSSDKAFVGQIDEVLAACSNEQVQRALFSATIGQQVKELAESVLRDPVFLTVGTDNAGAADIDQRLVYVGKEEGKLLAIRQLVQEGLRPPVLVFLQSKDRAKELFHELVYDGINSDVMHASRTQDQRDDIIQRFRTGEIWVLICTDLMARGIDFKGVNMVINYDFPQSAVSYIHRIGRTGRAGRHGVAVTLFTESDMDSLRSIANVMRLSGCEVPDWMLTMRKERRSDRRKRERGVPRRDQIGTVSKYDIRQKRRRQFMINDSKKAAARGNKPM